MKAVAPSRRPLTCISRDHINKSALKVLYRLRAKGHHGYLVGGCVRDLLLGRTPKDFDIATDATPNQIKRIFSNCRLIGRRFRLAHIHFGSEVLEVATFRALQNGSGKKGHKETVKSETGVVVRDNVFGTPEQDALRRDFTINALFYSISDFSIIDYAKALPDLEARLVRCIGDREAILRQHAHLAEASNARLYEEMLKIMSSGALHRALPLLRETGLHKVLFPLMDHWLDQGAGEAGHQHLLEACRFIDERKAADKVNTPALQYSLLFSAYHQEKIQGMVADGERFPHAVTEVLINHQQSLVPSILIPQRQLTEMIRITASQPAFLKNEETKAKKFKQMECFSDSFAYFRFLCDLHGENHENIPFWEALKVSPKSKRGRRRKRRPPDQQSAGQS